MRVVGARPEVDPPDLALKIKLNLDQLQALERRTHVDTLIEDPMDPVLFTQEEVRAMFRHVLPSSYSLPVRYLQGMFIRATRCLSGVCRACLPMSYFGAFHCLSGIRKACLSLSYLGPICCLSGTCKPCFDGLYSCAIHCLTGIFPACLSMSYFGAICCLSGTCKPCFDVFYSRAIHCLTGICPA